MDGRNEGSTKKKIDELKIASTKEMLKICELEESVMKIKKSNTEKPNVKQIDIQVKIKNETIEACRLWSGY